ncbi:MAG: hypothetical protein NZ551_02940 [Microscillaceae bacterium]|nr:hypothetical protein [Microscillaceae bacterium]MDW8460144.1 hypothetical protein [Cytophagales bacterium]
MKQTIYFFKTTVVASLSVGLFFLLSCNLDRFTSDKVDVKIEPQMVVPLAKGELSIDDQPDLSSIDYDLSFTLDIGVSGPVPLPVPPFSNKSSAPANFTIDEPIFSEMRVANFTFRGVLNSPFNITINKGAIIRLRNKNESTPFVTHVTTQDIPPRGQYNFRVEASNFVVKPNLVLDVVNVSSPGSFTPVDVSNNQVNVRITLEFLKLDYIDFPSGSVNEIEYTGEFELGLSNDDRFSGNIRIKFENRLPLNILFDVVFLESNQQTIAGQLTNPPIVLLQGTVDTPYRTSAMINATNILRDANKIKFIRAKAQFSVPSNSPTVRVDKTRTLRFQMIGDLKAQLNLGGN